MAVQRLSLQNIIDEILRITGYTASTLAPWTTDAILVRIINQYGQQIPIKTAQLAAKNGLGSGTIKFNMWRTVATVTGTSGSSNLDLPTDYDRWISWYDATNNRKLHVVEEVDRWHIDKLRQKPAGPPEAVEILGFLTSGSSWVRRAILYPDTMTGVTPSISLTYWRLPAVFPNSAPTTEYPDADYKYHSLWIYGPVLEVMRPNDPAYERYKALETELLLDLIMSGREV